MPRFPASNQRGVALITAVLIVAIVATVAAYLGLGQHVRMRQAQNLFDRAQADAVSTAVYQWAAVTLDEDTRLERSKVDALNEPWAQAMPPMPVKGGTVQGRISDAQGRFNVNNLVRNNKPSAADIGVFQRLLFVLGLDPNLSEAVVDWIDSDSQTRPNGAEDTEYLALDPPYRAANRPLVSIDELRLIRGFTAEIVKVLRPYVIALPAATSINVNTAPAPVLSALFANLPVAAAEQLVAARKNRTFYSADELASLARQPLVGRVETGVKSSYFVAIAETQYGRLSRRSEALIYRDTTGKQSAKVLWQSVVL